MDTKVTRSLFVRFGGLLEILRYFFSLIARKPYFGPFMLANQTWPIREPHMRRAIRMLIEEGKKEELRVLEIGSWAGQSAIIWGSELVRSASPGKVFCVDPWAPFTYGNQVGVNIATLKMDSVARRDRIYPLFWHNVKSSGLAGHVLPLRCKSTELLPYLIPGSFDLVFVDGSHAYTDFLADLSLVAPLVKQSGFMCGDDLEFQSDEVDLSFAEELREKDFVTDPKTRRNYHPGVCLGISHFFKRRVSVYDGFWVVRKVQSGWDNVQLYGRA